MTGDCSVPGLNPGVAPRVQTEGLKPDARITPRGQPL